MSRRRLLVERLHHADDVLKLGTEWDDLRRDSGSTSVFTTWAWIGAWVETEGAGADLEVVTARDPDSGMLLGVAPFHVARVRRGGIPVRELRYLGSGRSAPDHLDMLVSPAAGPRLAEDLWDATGRHRRWDLLNLDGISPAGHLAQVVARRRDDPRHALVCPFLALDGGWEAVEPGFSGRLRGTLDRYRRKLERDASVAEYLVADHDTLDDTFDALIRLHQSVRTARGNPGLFAGPTTRVFLRLAAHRLLDAGRLRMWRLDADGNPVAVTWCARGGDSVAFYTTGYDEGWSRYGPGRTLMARAIRGAIDEGAAEFDFLRGDEAYKAEWGAIPRHDLVVRRPTSALGRVLWTARGAVRVAASLRER